DAVCAIFYTGDISIVDNGDVLGLKVFFERLGDVIIESRAELRTTVQDGDLGAKLRKHRGKFHANGATANNDQRLWGFLQVLCGGGINNTRRINPRDIGKDRFGAGIDNDGGRGNS